jgi:hypothetical protein
MLLLSGAMRRSEERQGIWGTGSRRSTLPQFPGKSPSSAREPRDSEASRRRRGEHQPGVPRARRRAIPNPRSAGPMRADRSPCDGRRLGSCWLAAQHHRGERERERAGGAGRGGDPRGSVWRRATECGSERATTDEEGERGGMAAGGSSRVCSLEGRGEEERERGGWLVAAQASSPRYGPTDPASE